MEQQCQTCRMMVTVNYPGELCRHCGIANNPVVQFVPSLEKTVKAMAETEKELETPKVAPRKRKTTKKGK